MAKDRIYRPKLVVSTGTVETKPVVIIQDTTNEEPSTNECIVAFKKAIGHNFESFYNFYIKSTDKSKLVFVRYFGESGDTETNPGEFWIETLKKTSTNNIIETQNNVPSGYNSVITNIIPGS